MKTSTVLNSALATLVSFAAACGGSKPPATAAKLSSIREGMTPDETQRVLGKPVKDAVRLENERRWSYGDGTFVIFRHGEVSHFGSMANPPHYVVHTQSFNQGAPLEGKKVAVLPSKPGVLAADLDFRGSVAQYVERMLGLYGLTVAPADSADVFAFVNWETFDPQAQALEMRAVYMYKADVATTRKSRVKTQRVEPKPDEPVFDTVERKANDVFDAVAHGYVRVLDIELADAPAFRDKGKLEFYWQGRATSEGETGDIDQVLPVLCSSLIDTFGRATTATETINIYPNDPAIRLVKGEQSLDPKRITARTVPAAQAPKP